MSKPALDQSLLREKVCRRFSDYGFYELPGGLVGDAIDDLVEIANELDVEWRWSNTSDADALRHFKNFESDETTNLS